MNQLPPDSLCQRALYNKRGVKHLPNNRKTGRGSKTTLKAQAERTKRENPAALPFQNSFQLFAIIVSSSSDQSHSRPVRSIQSSDTFLFTNSLLW